MLKNRNLAKGGKGMKYYVYVAALTLAATGTAMAGVASPRVAAVPVFTPWGTLITAAALGAGGLFTFFRKKK
jgi:LPXTG-motif cell wall-anchored protein